MNVSKRWPWCAIVLAGCFGEVGAIEMDSGIASDAGVVVVVDASVDAGTVVIDSGIDAGVVVEIDAGVVEIDAGVVEIDAGVVEIDAGVVAPIDAGSVFVFDAGICVPIRFDAGVNSDVTPPTFISFSLTPTVIDTSTAQAVVNLRAEVADALGVANVVVSTVNEATGRQNVESLTWSAGVWSRDVRVPRFSPQGRTRVINVTATDGTGNTTVIAIDGGFTQTGSGDVAAPVIVSSTITPATIDTSGGDQQVVLSVHLTDDIAVQNAIVNYSLPGVLNTRGVALTRTAGVPSDGTFSATVTIPRFTPPGDIHFFVLTWDAFWPSTTQLLGHVQQLGAGDTTAPRVTALSFNPTSVDVSTSSAIVQIRMMEAPDLVGINRNNGLSAFVRMPDCTFTFAVFLPQADGSWAASLTIDQGMRPGRANLLLDLNDQLGNRKRYTSEELYDAGFPTGFDIR